MSTIAGIFFIKSLFSGLLNCITTIQKKKGSNNFRKLKKVIDRLTFKMFCTVVAL